MLYRGSIDFHLQGLKKKYIELINGLVNVMSDYIKNFLDNENLNKFLDEIKKVNIDFSSCIDDNCLFSIYKKIYIKYVSIFSKYVFLRYHINNKSVDGYYMRNDLNYLDHNISLDVILINIQKEIGKICKEKFINLINYYLLGRKYINFIKELEKEFHIDCSDIDFFKMYEESISNGSFSKKVSELDCKINNKLNSDADKLSILADTSFEELIASNNPRVMEIFNDFILDKFSDKLSYDELGDIFEIFSMIFINETMIIAYEENFRDKSIANRALNQFNDNLPALFYFANIIHSKFSSLNFININSLAACIVAPINKYFCYLNMCSKLFGKLSYLESRNFFIKFYELTMEIRKKIDANVVLDKRY